MAYQRGRELYIQVGNTANPIAYTSVGGLTSKTFSLSNEYVDGTNSDSPPGVAGAADDTPRAREHVEGAGMQSRTVSGNGVFTDTTVAATIRELHDSGKLRSFRVNLPGTGTYTGLFLITQFDYTGEHVGKLDYSMTLESSGSVTFTAAP